MNDQHKPRIDSNTKGQRSRRDVPLASIFRFWHHTHHVNRTHAPATNRHGTGRPLFSFVILACCCLVATGCKKVPVNSDLSLAGITDKLKPSNDRDWTPSMATLPYVTTVPDSNRLTIKNIRNSQYVSADQYIVQHYDRTIDVDQIQSVDYIVAPFNAATSLAHTMLSFGLDDGTYIGVSAEVRKERSESYSAVLGLGRKFELMYVVADERDLIRSRTGHRDTDVYVYPTVATPQQAQQLFVDMMQRVNELAVQPEFYHTLANNCTTNIQKHVNKITDNKVQYNWQVLLPAHSAKYAYDLGLIDNSLPFEELQSLALVNDLADRFYDAPDFSAKIRNRHWAIQRRIAARNEGENSGQAPRGGNF